MTAVTPTDRPKSVRDRCLIEVFGVVFYVVTLLFGFSCGCGGFCHRTESDLFLFLFWSYAVFEYCTRIRDLIGVIVWSILLIKSDLKWCINLSKSLFLN